MIIKNKSVCKGCKYVRENTHDSLEKHTCIYCIVNGKSRLLIEQKNGGYKKDSCICYEAGKEIFYRRPLTVKTCSKEVN